MLSSFLFGLIVFALAFAVISGIERLLHRLAHNPDRSYRWGVWLFSVLAGVFAFINELGR